MDSLPWFVAHTRPRCEKKLVEHCSRKSIPTALPCIHVAHQYRGKTVEFRKPLFPGYVFLQLEDDQPHTLRQNQHVANLLHVLDQQTFEHQLQQITTALLTQEHIRLVPIIVPGTRVRIKRGPLQGIEGWVQDRFGMTTVLLRLDFIGQAAAVKFHANDLQLL
jgi:transcription antitermination factor NusG